MIIFKGESIPKLYPRILQAILDNGLEVGPRGMKTKELSPITIISHDPRKRLFGHSIRKDVSIFTYIEGLWILLGEETPNRVVHYVKNMANYVNEKTGVFDGAYGPRLKWVLKQRGVKPGVNMYLNQLEECYKRLKDDLNSRRAVAIINNPIYDWNIQSKDIPCTILYQFLIRNNKLNMITYMRSQDAWLGLVYDTGEFQWFQEIMAGWLNLEVGTYTHINGSLHLYKQHWEKAQQLIDQDKNWDLYSKAEILDARLNKKDYDKTESILGLWEEACRTDNYKFIQTLEVENWIQNNDFYNNLLDIIMAYNLRLKGEKEEANSIIKNNQSDLGLIYRYRWLKEKI